MRGDDLLQIDGTIVSESAVYPEVGNMSSASEAAADHGTNG